MIGRDHAGAGVSRDILAVDVIQDRIAGAEFEDQALVRAFAAGIAQGAGAAQDRRDLDDGRDLLRQSRARENGLAIFGQALLGERDQLDHALVGLARVVAEGEDAVLVEDQPLDLSILSNTSAAFLARPKPGIR